MLEVCRGGGGGKYQKRRKEGLEGLEVFEVGIKKRGLTLIKYLVDISRASLSGVGDVVCWDEKK